MYKTLKAKIKGVSPLMVRNGQMTDPLNDWAKKLKVVSKKRVKTEADYQKMSELEWWASHYPDEKGRSCIPGEVLESMLIAAGKKFKKGPACKAGIIVDGLFPIIYSGPQTIEGLAREQKFWDRRRAKVGVSGVMRTRPIFHEWALEFEVMYHPDLLDLDEVEDIIEKAGQEACLCDYRPKYGRFEVESIAA